MTLETKTGGTKPGQTKTRQTQAGASTPAQTGGNDEKRKRTRKPVDVWLDTLVGAHRRTLKQKAWTEALAGILSIAQAGCLAFAVGALIEQDRGLIGVLPYAAALLLVILIRAMLNYRAGHLGHQVSAQIRYDLRARLAASLASQSPLDIERRSAGEIAALGSEVIESLDMYASRYLSLKLQLMIVPLAIIIAAAWISWTAALILLLCGPLIPVFMAIVGIRAKKASDEQISALSDMSSRFLDRISGMTTLRLFRSVGRTRDMFSDIATDYRRATMRVLRIAFLSSAALELFAALGIALIAIYVGYHYLGFADFGSYGEAITLSSGLFLLLLAPEFFLPLRDFSSAYHDHATARSAAERISQALPLESLSQEAPTPTLTSDGGALPQAAAVISKIAFEACDLGYDAKWGAILRDVSISACDGEKIAILGASGAGKSTLLAALCGFISPSSGQISINGMPAPDNEKSWEDLRATTAWIGQKPHIFHGSLLMNARLANPEADRDMVHAALKVAHADRFVAQLPRDELTILGETGFGISGGQVRRLAIARAALSHASLILCDEPTADLDADTAALITDSLMDMAEGRLLLVATHDEAVAERCDRIFYVHEGRVQEISKQDMRAIDQASLLSDDTSPLVEDQGAQS